MKFDELVKLCIQIMETYNTEIEGPDSHCDNVMRREKVRDTNERMFIKQTFFGVLRYSEFLKCFTEKFFNMNKASTERKDQNLYHVIGYLTIIRLDDLGMDDYKELIYSQDAVKMNEFFKFIFDIDILEEHLRPEWIKLYDYMFVDNTLIAGLMRNAELYSDLINAIYTKASGNQAPARISVKKTTTTSDQDEEEMEVVAEEPVKKKVITIPQPFNLTKPKPKVFKDPIQMVNQFTVKALPKSEEYYNKVTLDKLEEQRKDRLEIVKNNILKKYDENKPFDLETMKRPENIDKIRDEVNSKRNAELQFDNRYMNEPKDYTKAPANIKYNETAILREELHIQKEKKQEEDRLKRLLIDKNDSKEFERWRREMEMRDDQLKMEEVIKRKIEMNMAKEASENNLKLRILNNKLLVEKHKKEEREKNLEKQEMMKQELDRKKDIVKEIEKDRDNFNKDRKAYIEKMHENHLKQISDYKDILVKHKEEKAIEEEKRRNIIRQIRELESLPLPKQKGFDPTETSGYRLLEEMSLVELKERLQQEKQLRQQFIESKREENKLKNEEHYDNLIEKAKTISEHRDKMRNHREVKRQNKINEREMKEQMRQQLREKNLLELKNKIDDKKTRLRMEEEAFEKKIREIKLQRQYLQLGRAVVEEKAYKQIEDGVERKINNQQNKNLFEQAGKEGVKFAELNIRYNTAKATVNEKSKLLNSYDQTMQLLHRLTKDCNEEERNYLDQLHDRGRNIEQIQRERRAEKNSSNTKIEMSANTKGSKSTRHGTLDMNKISGGFKNSNEITKELATSMASKYTTIKFVRNQDYEKDSDNEEENLKEKLEKEQAV